MVKATTYRRDSPEVGKLCFRMIAETDAHSVGVPIAILLVIQRVPRFDLFETNKIRTMEMECPVLSGTTFIY